MATRWQHLLETISIIFQKLTLDKGASYKGVLSYVKDAYMSPIVMLRGPKNRYCHFFGINVASAQIFIDAY